MTKTLRNSVFILLASCAILFACSKKNDGPQTYVVSRTTSTTGVYDNAHKPDLSITPPNTTTTTTGTSANFVPCTTTINTASSGGAYPSNTFTNSYPNQSDHIQMEGTGPNSAIFFDFAPGVSPTDNPGNKIYNTVELSGFSSQQNDNEIVFSIIFDSDQKSWTAESGQNLYVSYDPDTKALSFSFCSVKLHHYDPSTGSYKEITMTGNFTGRY